MNYQIVEKDNNQVLIYIVAIAVIFFMFILPKLEKCNAKEENEVKEKFEQLKFEEVEKSKINKIDLKKRSKDCCLWEQWPAPHMPKIKSDKYIGTNFGTTGGCLCIDKKDYNYLSSRGKNFNRC